MKHAKEVQEGYRARKVKVIDRTKTFVLFIDFSKAFDKVNRKVLKNMMRRNNINDILVEAVMRLLNNSKVRYNDEVIETEVGCPQGSCLSPWLWNLYISELSEELNSIPASNLNAFMGLANDPLKT